MSSGSTGCGDLAVGEPILVADCVSATGPLPGLGATYRDDRTGQVHPDDTVQITPNGCAMNSPSTTVETFLHSTQPIAGAVVIIADFTAPLGAAADISLTRCTTSCTGAQLLTTERYSIFSGDRVLVGGDFNHDAVPDVPRLNVGTANRLVLRLATGRAEAWLNGRDLGGAGIGDTSQPGEVRFAVESVDLLRALEVTMERLDVYRSAGR